MTSEVFEKLPAQYLPTGDHAMLIAWTAIEQNAPGYTRSQNGHFESFIAAVLVLENGSVVTATLDQFKIDYRWSEAHQEFVDVSGITFTGESDGDSNQDPPDHGGPGVSGQVRSAPGAGEGGPQQEPDRGPGGLDASQA